MGKGAPNKAKSSPSSSASVAAAVEGCGSFGSSEAAAAASEPAVPASSPTSSAKGVEYFGIFEFCFQNGDNFSTGILQQKKCN